MKPTTAFLTAYFLEKVGGEPIQRRILLLRALAADTHDPVTGRSCAKEADELEQIEAKHRQLVLDFQRRADGQAGDGSKNGNPSP